MANINEIERPRILGIDPGSQVAGFAILAAKKLVAIRPSDFAIIEAGALRANSQLHHSERIGMLHEAMEEIVARQRPSVCVVEQAFHGVNARSALRLGEARGALISAVRRFGVPIVEVTPTSVKKAITGQGHATKEQVCHALKILINFERGRLPFDVSDALAIALSYGLTLPLRHVQASLPSTAPRPKTVVVP